MEKCGGDMSADLCSPAARDDNDLKFVPHRFATAFTDRDGKELLERQNLRTAEGRRTASRLRSCSGAGASAWLMANPTTRFTIMGNDTHSMAGRSVSTWGRSRRSRRRRASAPRKTVAKGSALLPTHRSQR